MTYNNNGLSLLLGEALPQILKAETLSTLFHDTVKNFPYKTALEFRGRKITYAELDEWSDKIAYQILAQKPRSNKFVAVWISRGIELHAAILGIVKAGAAYVPFDCETPADRVNHVIKQINISVCITDKNDELACSKLVPSPQNAGKRIINCNGPEPDDFAYVLFTSGTTGAPKGIPITHRQICHLVRAEQSIFEINSMDKVYQGFSVSFDMWGEEVWITYLAGAQLWIADDLTVKAIDEITEVLRENEITVLHAVPSILSIIDDNAPSLRLINAGGEACTPAVVQKWAHGNRKLFNSYGPTETTVTATISRLQRGDVITIGRPLPNYAVAIVDEELQPVRKGIEGELIIGGPGVSHGYLNMEELSARKFISKSAVLSELPGERLYRTGDQAKITADDQIVFYGRMDDQVKLRGYRIELREIEILLTQQSEVKDAAVVLVKDNNKQDQLVAYITCNEQIARFDEERLKLEIGKFLPNYMVPASIIMLEDMPRLFSGKINKKALVGLWNEERASHTVATSIDLTLPVKERILSVFKQVFPLSQSIEESDFFDDLGGHSLLAALLVSKLRQESKLLFVSLKDIYQHRPVKDLLNYWENKEKISLEKKVYKPSNHLQAKRSAHTVCAIAQLLSLFIIYGLFSVQIFLPYLAYYYVLGKYDSHILSILTAFLSFCFIPPLITGCSILAKWAIIGKYKAGDYPLWGQYYFRWWFVSSLQKLAPVSYMNGTPLYNAYLRLRGLKVSFDAQLGNFEVGAEDLVSIGRNVSIGSGAILNNSYVENGYLKLRAISISNDVYIGSGTVIAGDNVIPPHADIGDLSYLPARTPVAENEVWQGSPCQRIAQKKQSDAKRPYIGKMRFFTYCIIYSSLLFLFPMVTLIPLVPNVIALIALDDASKNYDFSYIVVTPFLALLYILLFIFLATVITRGLSKNLKAEKYSIYSGVYVKKWFIDQVQDLALFVLHPIYASIFIAPLYRMFGAKVGKNTEISTASQVTHRFLEVGEQCFVADAVMLGESEIRNQSISFERTKICSNSFVGNSALIPQGYQLPSHMLIGVLSMPPKPEVLSVSDIKDWFGSPAIALPKREKALTYPTALTFLPSKGRRLARGFIETCRIILPIALILCFSTLYVGYTHALLTENTLPVVVLLFPFYYLKFIGVPCFLICVLLKWIVMGKYEPKQTPMWTLYVWCTEAITTFYEALAIPFLLTYLEGTVFLPWALRCFGVKIGRRTWLNTTDFTEFDLVSLGDEVALNKECGPQTHLFEDRIMKTGRVAIKSRTTVGSRSIILYDAVIGENVILDPVSLVMKGETVTDNSHWCGSPINLV